MDTTTLAEIYLLIVNLVLFLLMGIDKFKAQTHRWRIPEKTLLLFGLFGGGLGGLLGQRIFHHKTRKPVFYAIFSIGVFILGGVFFLIR